MTTWRDPHLSPVYHWQYEKSGLLCKAKRFKFPSTNCEPSFAYILCVRSITQSTGGITQRAGPTLFTGIHPLKRFACVARCSLLYKEIYQHFRRVALVKGLNQTPHGTSWRQPCNTCISIYYPVRAGSEICQELVRFCALFRIKPHVPPLVWAPSIPLSFNLAVVLLRRRI